MILSAATTEVRNGLQYLQQSTAGDALILLAFKRVQDSLERGKTLPRFLLTEDATFTGSANVATAALPSDFIRFAEDQLPYDNSSGTELEIGEYAQLRKVWLNNTSTVTSPMALARRKSSIVVFPTPSAAWTIKYSYYAKAAVLANSNDENLWLLNVPYLMIAGAGLLMASDRGDSANVAKFQGLYAAASRELLASIVDDELAGESVLMGQNW